MLDKSGVRQSLSDDEKRSTKGLITALETFRELRRDMPLQYVYSFLLVAEEEGLGVNEYAKKAGVSSSVMSRHLLDIGEEDRNHNPGFMLVEGRPDRMDRRNRLITLTDKGRAIARRIMRAWARNRDTEADSSLVRPGASPSQKGMVGGCP
jgi:DNA-binding MarR family transcriptional regulator